MKVNLFGFIASLVLYVPIQSMENELFLRDVESVIEQAFQKHNPHLVEELLARHQEIQLSDSDHTTLKLYISHVFKAEQNKIMENWQEISEIIYAKKSEAMVSNKPNNVSSQDHA